jgi:hypothetical protein
MENKSKIGILYICTGKYVVFWRDFFQSAEKYFLPEIEKHYFVFTDSREIDFSSTNNRIHIIYQENLGWPDNTLKRFHIFLSQEEKISKMNYIIFCNANLKFIETISAKEFIPEKTDRLIAVQHPGFFNKKRNKFTYEKNKKSTAYITPDKGRFYVAGGLNGGYGKDFLQAMKIMKQNIEHDYEKGIIAKWHDESHWNRYVVDRPDVKVLDVSYLYPEGLSLPFNPKIIVRDKMKYGGHELLRDENGLMAFLKRMIRKIKFIFLYAKKTEN